jgi:hypothetical protein
MKSILSEKPVSSSKTDMKTKSYNHSYGKKPGGGGGGGAGGTNPNQQQTKQPHKRGGALKDDNMFKKADNFNVLDVVSGMKKKEDEEKKRKKQQEFADFKAMEQRKALLAKRPGKRFDKFATNVNSDKIERCHLTIYFSTQLTIYESFSRCQE